MSGVYSKHAPFLWRLIAPAFRWCMRQNSQDVFGRTDDEQKSAIEEICNEMVGLRKEQQPEIMMLCPQCGNTRAKGAQCESEYCLEIRKNALPKLRP